MRLAKPLLVAALVAAALPLTGCAPAAAPPGRVVIRVEPSARPEAYEVHLAQADAGFRSTFRLRSGQTRSVTVPKGWITVRVAGLCVLPAPTTGTTTVEVRPNDCRVV
ncbi:hypothetical protein [Amnibacterium kyonggiense]|uniref:hypothetical protein n=1 Tax=Amnibacterium kyonggiense TaxID=595671 RepID=UPI00105EA10B|nr:hypothetical protein [Amnibacterium kyonggiense]